MHFPKGDNDLCQHAFSCSFAVLFYFRRLRSRTTSTQWAINWEKMTWAIKWENNGSVSDIRWILTFKLSMMWYVTTIRTSHSGENKLASFPVSCYFNEVKKRWHNVKQPSIYKFIRFPILRLQLWVLPNAFLISKLSQGKYVTVILFVQFMYLGLALHLAVLFAQTERCLRDLVWFNMSLY